MWEMNVWHQRNNQMMMGGYRWVIPICTLYHTPAFQFLGVFVAKLPTIGPGLILGILHNEYKDKCQCGQWMKQAGFPLPITSSSLWPVWHSQCDASTTSWGWWQPALRLSRGQLAATTRPTVKWQKMGECWAELAAHQHQGRKAPLTPRFHQQCRVAVALSSPKIFPPSPLQFHHSLLDVLQRCLGTRIPAEIKKKKTIHFFLCHQVNFLLL